MQPWLLIAAAAQAASAASAGVDLKGLAPVEIGHVAKAHALDLRLSQEIQNSPTARLIRGMIVQRAVAPNAAIGLGLSNLYERRKGFDIRDDGRPKRSKRPAVTFVLKF